MKVKASITSADGTTWTRETDRFYRFAVVYHRVGSGYFSPTYHGKLHLAQRAAADIFSNVHHAEIVPVVYQRPSDRQIKNAIAKIVARMEQVTWKPEVLARFAKVAACLEALLADEITIEHYLGLGN
jgi:hypothetical protein